MTLRSLRQDLSYDFITRPAYLHAILCGNAEFLQLMVELMAEYKVDASSLIHAMQNHDEITYELVHFLKHKDRQFVMGGKTYLGTDLREKIRSDMMDSATSHRTPYNALSGLYHVFACAT